MSRHVVETGTIYNENSKIWSGPRKQVKYNSDCSIGKVVLEVLMKTPEHIAQICYHNGKQYTNLQIANYSISVAQHFRKLNFKQCDIIGICAANSDYLAPLYFGAMLAGLTVSTLDPSFDKDGIKHIYSITQPVAMFCDGAIYECVKEALSEINLPITIYTMKDHLEGVAEITEFLNGTEAEVASYEPEPLKFGGSQVAAILCSSGTTGLPKGVCMSHESLLNAKLFNLIDEDTALCFSTLYWLSGILVLVVGTIQNATRIINDQRFCAEDFFDIVEKYKVNVIFVAPSIMALASASPRLEFANLSSLSTFLCGGSATPYALVAKLKPYMQNTTFISVYGMSEICSAIAVGPVKSNGNTGKLVSKTDIKIIDDEGEQVGPNETGEICIRLFFPWAGYYGNPEATAVAFENNEWLHSGDIGYIDEQGYLFVIDRKKDILKYNNFHFFPTEIESVIYELPGMSEVCVCGIADIVATYLPAAAIKKTPNTDLNEAAVYQHVESRMAHFKHLRGGVYFFDELPKTASGKHVRREVTSMCEQQWDACKHNQKCKKLDA